MNVMKNRLLALSLGSMLTGTAFAQNAPFTAYEEKLPGTDLTFKMMPIPAGEFSFGSPAGEKGRGTEKDPVPLTAFTEIFHRYL